MMKSSPNSVISILPLLIFVTVFLGFGIYQNDFYALPSPIAALVGIVSAFMIFRGSIHDKIDIFLKGCGDGKILTMCFIYLLAGAFATVSKTIGSVESIVNLGLAYISPQYFAAGIFFVASFLSFASGTSVGSIVTLAPIVIDLAEKSQSPLGLVSAALLCGAMFGDNLSIISDTTIAATQSLNCEMKDKFRANFKLAFPAAILAFIVFLYLGNQASANSVITLDSANGNPLLILPYLLVIGLSIAGINVFVTLFCGILFSGVLGLYFGNFDFLGFTKTTYEGFTGMTEIFLLSLFTGGLAALVEKAGGIQFLLNKISRFINNRKNAMLGIGSLVSVTNLCVANNTIAILISGNIAKKITDKFGLKPKESASVLDIFACYVQGLIPYGAQVLILISLSQFKISYTELFLNAWYLHILLLATILYILLGKSKK
ncbi:MAG: Na+/H+ antiporter NhaC family protein [Cruoricaptor ignavus]|nr:Na+/H+ antiporter NhaC family protein [Cruoricaptor ignavus]